MWLTETIVYFFFIYFLVILHCLGQNIIYIMESVCISQHISAASFCATSCMLHSQTMEYLEIHTDELETYQEDRIYIQSIYPDNYYEVSSIELLMAAVRSNVWLLQYQKTRKIWCAILMLARSRIPLKAPRFFSRCFQTVFSLFWQFCLQCLTGV